MTDRLNARIAIPLLAVVGALSGCGGGDTGSTTRPAPTQVAASTCATPPQLFTTAVWPSMSSTCVVCHRTGAVASGTRLVFSPGASAEVNYAVLRTFGAANSDLLMSKSIGLPTHSGGAPFTNANSQQYKDLSSLLPKLKESCSTEVIATGEFWKGVKLADNATTLQKAANLFIGRNPTYGEKVAVEAGGEAALRQQMLTYMNDPAFDGFLNEAGQVQFHINTAVIYGGGRGIRAADFPAQAAAVINNQNAPAGVRARVETTLRNEPITFLKETVKRGRPWTDMVQGEFTYLNSITAITLGAQVQGTFMNPANDNEFLPAVMPNLRSPNGMRETAGVIAMHTTLDILPTTDTNRNRHRVSELMKRFTAVYIPLLASRPLEDGVFRNAVTDNPGCTVCHDIMDPIAGTLQNWAPNNAFRPNGAGAASDALSTVYKSTDYFDDAKGNEFFQMGDKWYRDGRAPGYNGTPMPNAYNNPTAALWLGKQMAADPRFAVGGVAFWYRAVFHRDPLPAPTDSTGPDAAARLAAYNAQQDEFKAMGARFAAGGYNVKNLLVDLMMSNQARATGLTEQVSAQRAVQLAAVGGSNLLSTQRLQRKYIGLFGTGFAGFNNPFAGPGLTYGNFNAGELKNPQTEYTSNQVTSTDAALVQSVCRWAADDFAKPVDQRLLVPYVTMTDTPANKAGADKILQNIQYLHEQLWNERLPTTHPEVQRTYALFVAVWNDRNNTEQTNCQLNADNDPQGVGRAWATTFKYFGGDRAFMTF